MSATYKPRKSILAFTLLSLLACFVPAAGQVTQEPPEDPPIKVDTVLLNIPVIVSDRDGRNIAGLKKEDFHVFVGGREQKIDFFANAEASMNVAIILDTSVSARPVIGRITKAAREFLTLLGPEDQAIIITFDKEVSVMQRFTADKEKLRRAIGDAFVSQEVGSNMMMPFIGF